MMPGAIWPELIGSLKLGNVWVFVQLIQVALQCTATFHQLRAYSLHVFRDSSYAANGTEINSFPGKNNFETT